MGEREYQYVCPNCGQAIAVNAPMRDALLSNGCVVCGARVSDEAFSSPPAD